MALRDARILAQTNRRPSRRGLAALAPGQWVAVFVLAFIGVAAFGVAPDSTLDLAPQQSITRDLPAPALQALADDESAGFWREERVQRGDTLGRLFARLGVDDPDALEFVRRNPIARELYQLRPGRPLRVETDADGQLLALRFLTGSNELLSISRHGDTLAARLGPVPTQVQWKMAVGEISSSLFAAADAAGLPDAVTRQLADVFAADIDFYHDLRRGDHFAVVYEMRYIEGEPVGPGRIIAAEFVNDGATYRAFLWRSDNGRESYYDDTGKSLRRAFLRSPMEFSRITSGFTRSRFHPIDHVWRAHRGVDYGAPSGTPVRATADGRVVYVGYRAGYGKVIHIQHQGSYSTLYAHLSRFATSLAQGRRVLQGDVIGYVGQTGWATGPHLHYEFRVNNDPRDPDRLALPNGEPLAPSQKTAFLASVQSALAQLTVARSMPSGMVAASE